MKTNTDVYIWLPVRSVKIPGLLYGFVQVPGDWLLTPMRNFPCRARHGGFVSITVGTVVNYQEGRFVQEAAIEADEGKIRQIRDLPNYVEAASNMRTVEAPVDVQSVAPLTVNSK